jgi:hypothetical protein
VLAAIVLHASFCEWRTTLVEAERAGGLEARALWIARRVAHESGNAARWDARKLELRAYHAQWLACWEAESVASASESACRKRLGLAADDTTRAVLVSECEAEQGAPLSARAGFRDCLAARGYRDARAPRWTRDDFGPRFAGPYLELTGLFAETTRASGAWLGVGAPLALAAIAIELARVQSST